MVEEVVVMSLYIHTALCVFKEIGVFYIVRMNPTLAPGGVLKFSTEHAGMSVG